MSKAAIEELQVLMQVPWQHQLKKHMWFGQWFGESQASYLYGVLTDIPTEYERIPWCTPPASLASRQGIPN